MGAPPQIVLAEYLETALDLRREFRDQAGGDVVEQEGIDGIGHPRDDKLNPQLACVGPVGNVVPVGIGRIFVSGRRYYPQHKRTVE
jgi:hypothetical protein